MHTLNSIEPHSIIASDYWCIDVAVNQELWSAFLIIIVGTVIGELPNLDHGIQGTLIALDETTLFIKNFHYDGQAPGIITTADLELTNYTIIDNTIL